MLLSGAFQLYPPVGWVDPGLYLYWFLSPADNVTMRGADYHGARLPFVLPGALLYRLLDPANAQAVLVLGYHALGTLALGAVAARLAPVARLAVVLVVALNPLWIAAFARGYVDGPAMACALAALACALPRGDDAPAPSPRWRAALAGAWIVLAAVLHPLAGGLAGLTVLGVLAVRTPGAGAHARDLARDLARDGAALALGAAGALLVLAALGALAGLPFLFMGVALPAVAGVLKGSGAGFLQPFGAWGPGAHRLVLVPLIAALVVAAWGPARRGGGGTRPLLVAALVPLAAIGAYQAWSGALLPFPFYASYLFLPLAPALVLLAARAGAGGFFAGARGPALVALAVLGPLGLGLGLPLAARAAPAFLPLSWAVVLAAGASGALALLRRRHGAAFGLVALALALAGAFNRDTATVLRLPDAPDLAAQHRALGRFRAGLAAAGAAPGPYRHWFDREGFTAARGIGGASLYALTYNGVETRLNALDSLAASLGWDVGSLGFAMPRIDPAARPLPDARYPAPVALITLCAEAPGCEQGLAAVRATGRPTEPLARFVVDEPGAPRVAVAVDRVHAPGPARPDDAAVALSLGPAPAGSGGAGVVRDVVCEGPPGRVACAFAHTLADGRRGAAAALFERPTGVWRAVPAGPEPDAAIIAAAVRGQLLEGPEGARIAAEGVTVRAVRDLACEGPPAARACAFAYVLSSGEAGTARLSLRLEGYAWWRAT